MQWDKAHRWPAWVVLSALFVVSVPLITPYLRGDGVGYYAWLRSAVIDHDLQFANEYRHGDPVTVRNTFDEHGQVRVNRRTGNGHVDNHWGVGVAVLWAPFFLVAHGTVLLGRAVGLHWRADGFSMPYRWACAFGTAVYGFLALLIAHHLARRRVSERAALIGVVAVWGASSLFIYQYLLPFWPFGAGAFVGAALLALWDRRDTPSTGRWLAMGALTGLAFAIHPVTAAWGVLPLLAILRMPAVRDKVRAAMLVGAALPLGAAPQLVGKAIVYGSPFASGYDVRLRIRPRELMRILVGADHGLFSWTPVALVALVGIAWPLWRRDRRLAVALLAVFGAMVGIVAFFQLYEQSSYGNRFFVVFTPGFAIGGAALYESARRRWREVVLAGISLLIAWNVLFAFQWAWGMTRKQGPVNWRTVASNQVTRAPRELVHALRLFVTDRGALIRHVQEVDLQRRREGRA